MSPEAHRFFWRRKVARYSLAVLAAAAAIAVRAMLDPWVGDRFPFTIVFLAIVFVAWKCGVGPCLVTIVLGFVGGDYFLLEPRYSFGFTSAGNVGEGACYFLISLGILWFVRAQKRTYRSAVANEQLARDRLHELETLYQQVPIGLCLTDSQHRYIRINERLASTTGHTPEQRIGHTVWEMVPELDPILRPVFDHVLATGEPVDNLEIHARLKGSPDERWWLGNYHPLRDSEGRVVGINSTVMEITKLKQAEARIQQINLELEHRIQERTADLESFTYSVAHDLRAPVRGICSLTELALMDSGPQLSPDNRQLLQTVVRAATRMDRLIMDLLSLSKLSRHELEQKTVNLSDLADSIVIQIRKAHPRRSTRVSFDIAPGLTVCGDEHFLRIALDNLLDNAWKFTSTHSSGHIEFGCQRQDGERVFFVRDDGIGFDMAHAGRMFGIFERLHDEETTDTSESGTGMGLALVERIITRHGGRIWAMSAPGQGATFYFTISEILPLRQSEPTSGKIRSEKLSSRTVESG